jgi:hypothetical protein
VPRGMEVQVLFAAWKQKPDLSVGLLLFSGEEDLKRSGDPERARLAARGGARRQDVVVSHGVGPKDEHRMCESGGQVPPGQTELESGLRTGLFLFARQRGLAFDSRWPRG